jgi:hypothetical protein
MPALSWRRRGVRFRERSPVDGGTASMERGSGGSEVAKALKIGRASVFRVLEGG